MLDFIEARDGGATLWLSVITGPGLHATSHTLLDDAIGLVHFFHANQVTVVTVARFADRNIKVHGS
jgi:hypothetical protein